jgi:L-fuculokinase
VLCEELDTLANVDAFGEPVATARFMGGREYAAICGADALDVQPSRADLDSVLDSGTLVIPSFANEGGPFRTHRGRIVGRELAPPPHRAALAALYCALMTDHCTTMLAAQGDLIIEGRLADNDAFSSALASLRAPQPVFRSCSKSGTLEGALVLSQLAKGEGPKRAKIDPCPAGEVAKLNAARLRWQSLLPATTGG